MIRKGVVVSYVVELRKATTVLVLISLLWSDI
jgi:hypothetical protein